MDSSEGVNLIDRPACLRSTLHCFNVFGAGLALMASIISETSMIRFSSSAVFIISGPSFSADLITPTVEATAVEPVLIFGGAAGIKVSRERTNASMLGALVM
ncbi:hypothetical protein D3C73_1280780 [compost metagenome]